MIVSGLSDFLTHATAPWWSTLAGTVIGSIGTVWGGTALERIKDRNAVRAEIRKSQRDDDTRTKELTRELGAKLLAECWKLGYLAAIRPAKERHQEVLGVVEAMKTGRPLTDQEAALVKPLAELPEGLAEMLSRVGSTLDVSEDVEALLLLYSDISIRLPRDLTEVGKDLVLATVACAFQRWHAAPDVFHQLIREYEKAALAFTNALRSHVADEEPLTLMGILLPGSREFRAAMGLSLPGDMDTGPA